MYDRFGGLMKGICMRYATCEDEAEDILQESFIKIFKNLKKYQNNSLGGWIRTITVNSCLEHYRKQKSYTKMQNEVQMIKLHHTDEHTLLNLHLEDLLKKINSLPMGARLVFNMYAIEGFNHKEIAEKLGISEGTSKSQYARAKIALQRMIENERIDEINLERHVR